MRNNNKGRCQKYPEGGISLYFGGEGGSVVFIKMFQQGEEGWAHILASEYEQKEPTPYEKTCFFHSNLPSLANTLLG